MDWILPVGLGTRLTIERRNFPRVEMIVHGWYRCLGQELTRCKTMDVSERGCLLLVEEELEEGGQFELYLDFEADWEVELLATVLWQRKVFYGRQIITAVSYDFARSGDKSLLGVWLRKRIDPELSKDYRHLAPKDPNAPLNTHAPLPVEPEMDRWRELFRSLRSKLPWLSTRPVLKSRRAFPRVPVGLDLAVEEQGKKREAQLLDVSAGGLRIHLQDPVGKNPVVWVPKRTLLIGRRRLSTRCCWQMPSTAGGQIVGLEVIEDEDDLEASWFTDLLRRLDYYNYQPRTAIRVPLTVKAVLFDKSGQEVAGGNTLDLGVGGALLQLDRDLPKYEMFSLVLEAPEKPVRLAAQIVHRHETEEGVRLSASFSPGDTEDHLRLSLLLGGVAKWRFRL